MRGIGRTSGIAAFVTLLLLATGAGTDALAHGPHSVLPGTEGSADVVDLIHFNWVLTQYGRSAEGDLACTQFSQLTDADLGFDVRMSTITPRGQQREHGYQCAPRMDPENFCRAVENGCRRRTAGVAPPIGSRDCWRWPGVSPPESEDLRPQSQAVRRRTMLYAASTFLELKNDPVMLDRCCGESDECKEHVRGVELEFMDGLPRHDRTAYYLWDAGGHNHVRISTSYLMNALSSEAIDWILLHELGHACQFGKAIGMSTETAEERVARAAALEGLSGDHCEGGEGAFGYATSLGFETGACIRDAVHDDLPRHVDQGLDVCYSQWLEEAFASSVFAFRMNTVEQWGWMCRNEANEDHPVQQVFIGCLLNDPRIRRNFCED